MASANIDPAGAAALRPPSGSRSVATSPAPASLSGSSPSEKGTRPLGPAPPVPGARSLPLRPAPAPPFGDKCEYARMTSFFSGNLRLCSRNGLLRLLTYWGYVNSCGEQFMMSEKAKLFGDMTSCDKIMAATDPMTHKFLGRNVRPFDYAEWERRREEIVLTGSYAKFAQNHDMKTSFTGDGLCRARAGRRNWSVCRAATTSTGGNPEGGTIFDSYRPHNIYITTSGLIQHSTSPWASPLVVIPKKDGSVRITVNYKRLNALVDLDGQPLPRVDGILDSLYTGKVFSIFDLNSAFHYIICDEDTVPPTAFCTPTQLFEWLRMPQGANASPSWFVKVINRVVHGLERVLAYLDDVICFDEEPLGHVLNLIEFFKRLRQYNLKLSPGKARVGATHANFLGHTISPGGVSPDGVKVRALTHMPPPTNVKQLRSLLGGLSYYRKFLKNLATKVRPLNSLLKQGVPFKYTPGMVKVVKTLLRELARPPIFVFPDWAAIEDNSRPLRLCSDARANLPAERNWTVLDLEAGGIVWAIKRLRGYLWSTKFIIYSDHKALESIGKVGEHNARVQRWLEFLSNFTYTLKYRKGSANGNADFLSRLPLPAQDTDKTGPDCIDGVDQAGAFLIRACGRSYHSSATPETARWPVIAMPLPKGPGTVVGVDFFGPLPVTAKGNSYILLFTDRFSRRADMFAVTAAEFTARGTAHIFVNQYMTKWGCPTTLLSDNGLHFCSKLSMAIYEVMKIKKVTTSSYHPQTNGGTERVNHTMAQMLAVVVNEQQHDWDVHLPHVEFAYNNSVNQSTGLAANEIHIGRIPRLPLSVFDRPTVGGHQSLARDQLEYCNLAVDRQRRAYELVREYNALKISRVERRNSSLQNAIHKLPQFTVGGWAWVYNTAATIRQGVQKDTDQQVLKAKFALS
ncbi:unnamed protein product [Ectocarpus sp. CCAP 1310/34]|nr:unnamed protein product [Ectocarpus sp. CCAP 1310/34]